MNSVAPPRRTLLPALPQQGVRISVSLTRSVSPWPAGLPHNSSRLQRLRSPFRGCEKARVPPIELVNSSFQLQGQEKEGTKPPSARERAPAGLGGFKHPQEGCLRGARLCKGQKVESPNRKALVSFAVTISLSLSLSTGQEKAAVQLPPPCAPAPGFVGQ